MADKKDDAIKKSKPIGIKMLVYGAAGSGKSIFASTFPKPLILDTDGGHSVYQSQGTFPGATYIESSQCIAALQKVIKMAREGKCEYETLVIDSLTAFENLAVSRIKGLDENNIARSLYSGSVYKLDYDDWAGVSGSTIALFSLLRSLPINVVMITQLANKGDKHLPQLVGKGQNEALHYPDFVGYMAKTDDNERELHLTSKETDNFVAKARLGMSEVEPILNPNYDKIADLIGNQKVKLDF